MISSKKYRIWQKTNLAVILAGLILPWKESQFEPGNEILIYSWDVFVDQTIRWFDLIIFLSGIFTIYYLIRTGVSIFNTQKRFRVISLLLLLLIIITVRELITSYWLGPLLPGIYLFVTGIFSAAIFEWQRDTRIEIT
jgi:hypothetical protein